MLPYQTAKFARQHLVHRIEALLDRWTSDRRQPDSWESYYLVEAIDHLARGAYVQGEGDVARAEAPKTWSKPDIRPPSPFTIDQLRARVAAVEDSA